MDMRLKQATFTSIRHLAAVFAKLTSIPVTPPLTIYVVPKDPDWFLEQSIMTGTEIKLNALHTIISTSRFFDLFSRGANTLVEAKVSVSLDKYIGAKQLEQLEMSKLERLHLRIFFPHRDPKFERALHLPVIRQLCIEKVVGNRPHYWDLHHYGKCFSRCTSGSFVQLTFADIRRHSNHYTHQSPSLDLSHPTSYSELELMLQQLPALQELRLRCAVSIHLPTLEKLGNGSLLPCLHTLELTVLDYYHVFQMIQMRNNLDGSSDLGRTLRSSIEELHITIPHDLQAHQEIVQEGKDLQRRLRHKLLCIKVSTPAASAATVSGIDIRSLVSRNQYCLQHCHRSISVSISS